MRLNGIFTYSRYKFCRLKIVRSGDIDVREKMCWLQVKDVGDRKITALVKNFIQIMAHFQSELICAYILGVKSILGYLVPNM